MMKQLPLVIFLVIISSIKAQENLDSLNTKPNPIIFGDFSLGYSNGFVKGFTVGGSVNYQKKNNLFTFRTLQVINIKKIDFFLIFPYNIESETMTEYSLLYGKRYIEEGFSYHFSGGISFATYDKNFENDNLALNYFGFPVEVGVSWFKNKKRRFRVLYGLIPVGKPTSFGRSIGFKLHANIAKRSYVGLGLTFGLGWHKIYNDEE